MMHPWNVQPTEAVALQRQLREEVRLVPFKKQPRIIGGCDVSMNRFAKEGYAGFVTLSYPDCVLRTHAVVQESIPFPYIPGLLSFREIPMLLSAWDALSEKPDVLVADGVGVAHPRGLGIASHLGILLDIPTIGCAKSVLMGIYDEPTDEVGASNPLQHPKTGEVIGAALRTKKGCKPVFVSPGHRITLEDALTIMRTCIQKHRIPEPTRQAHLVVNEYRVQQGV